MLVAYAALRYEYRLLDAVFLHKFMYYLCAHYRVCIIAHDKAHIRPIVGVFVTGKMRHRIKAASDPVDVFIPRPEIYKARVKTARIIRRPDHSYILLCLGIFRNISVAVDKYLLVKEVIIYIHLLSEYKKNVLAHRRKIIYVVFYIIFISAHIDRYLRLEIPVPAYELRMVAMRFRLLHPRHLVICYVLRRHEPVIARIYAVFYALKLAVFRRAYYDSRPRLEFCAVIDRIFGSVFHKYTKILFIKQSAHPVNVVVHVGVRFCKGHGRKTHKNGSRSRNKPFIH